MRVLFWGSPAFALAPLACICDSPHQVVGVVCQPDRPRGRGRDVASPEVKLFALNKLLKVYQPEVPRDTEFMKQISSVEPDISVVVAYGHILRPEVLEIPSYGSINLHASLLPAYRGAAPIQRAIANGETLSGLTVIQMDEGMDTGPMLARVEVEIGRTETAGELAGRLSECGGKLLLEVLGRIEKGECVSQSQPEIGVSYAPKIGRAEARIDWTWPADKIARLIRAFDPAPGAFCLRKGGRKLKLFRPEEEGRSISSGPGEVTASESGKIAVGCGDGKALIIREIQAEGKKRMSVEDFLRGARLEHGEVLL